MAGYINYMLGTEIRRHALTPVKIQLAKDQTSEQITKTSKWW